MIPLKGHWANSHNDYQVQIDAHYQQGQFLLDFQLQTPTCWNLASGFNDDARKNWGLWQKDVVEVFLQKKNQDDYQEFQFSPDEKSLELVIHRPRKILSTPLIASAPWKCHKLQEKTWHCQWKMDLNQPQEYKIGVFAILGFEQRCYFSLNPNSEEQADFHRPELFVAVRNLLEDC